MIRDPWAAQHSTWADVAANLRSDNGGLRQTLTASQAGGRLLGGLWLELLPFKRGAPANHTARHISELLSC